MKISDRLGQIRIKLDISQPEAAIKFDIPLPSWKNYEKGPSEPGSGALRKLAEGGVNINWLLTGTGEMLLVDQAKDVEKTAPCQINTQKFVKILERLQESDIEWNKHEKTYIGYYAAIIYNRIMPYSQDFFDLNLGHAIEVLNLIFIDRLADYAEIRIGLAKDGKLDKELLDIYQKQLDEYNKLLRQRRGKFTGRMLAPGTSFESEFISGKII